MSAQDKRDLLAKLLAQKALEESQPLPLAPAQERLWFLEQLSPGTSLYNIAAGLRLTGPLDAAILERSLTEIMRRHEPLRAKFMLGVNSLPAQVTEPCERLSLPLTDLTELTPADAEAEVLRLAREDGGRPIDLTSGRLLRAQLIRMAPERHVLLFVVHHIVSDLWSVGVILSELSALYEAFRSGKESPLPELPTTYAAYVQDQRQYVSSAAMELQLAYWREKLGGRLPVLQLPADRPRPAIQTFVGTFLSLPLGRELTDAVKALARSERVTLYMFLLTAFKVLLYRYTRQTDLLVGTPIANRQRADVEPLVGLFINTLVLRTDLSGEPSFRELLVRVRDTCLGAYAHQEVDFARLMSAVSSGRSLGAAPLFQVMFSLENAPLAPPAIPGLIAEMVEVFNGTAKFDLTLTVGEEADGLVAFFEYNTDLFDEATIRRMGGHFRDLLAAAAADPGARIDDLPVSAADEMAAWNDTATEYPRDATIHRLFEAQAARKGEATALVCGDEAVSYRELNRRANRLARYLRRLGVGPDVPVGLCLERGPDMAVGLLAILKAGGAYVPLDPTYPRDRIAYMLQDSGAPVLIAAGQQPDGYAGRLVDLERDGTAIAAEPEDDLDGGAAATNLAYVIYTSGSTGRPKGVMLEHRSVVNFLTSMERAPGLTEADVLLAVTSISFDIAGLELYLPLTTGAKVVLASRTEALDGARLANLLRRHGVTVMQATPATWRLLLESGWQAPAGLKMLVGGEALPRELANRLLAGDGHLWNMYGPTETTIWSTIWQVESGAGPVLIGRPIANTQAIILDGQLRPVPVGVAGELYIGGDGLARGYLNRPELTAERFVDSPFGRIYRTGDMARYRTDGAIEFLGRADQQVKLRGFRIELGEIEAVLEGHRAVAQAVVAAREIGGETELVAYYVARPGTAPAVPELRSHLKEKLPEYMVPGRFLVLEGFPLTPNGKVDRKALPDPTDAVQAAAPATSVAAAPAPPEGDVERTVAAIWRAVLRVEHVGLHDNFFDLGGHSLRAVQLLNQLKLAISCPLELLELFQCPTVATQAQLIRSRQGAVLVAAGPAASGPAIAAPAAVASPPAPEPEPKETGRVAIAIVGMAGRFPGAGDVETFWRQIRDGVDALTRFTPEELDAAGEDPAVVRDPRFVPVKGVLTGADTFDAAFFGVTPREAETLDPQHRVFLETAWEALEHAGYDPDQYPGRIGVWAGAGFNNYVLTNLAPNRAFVAAVGGYQLFLSNEKDFLTSRTAYKLNLKGPAVTVQTACSTSLVAVHQACQSLVLGECEMALAGGVSVTTPLNEGYIYQEGHILSPDGACRTFDAAAAGTVLGNGVGLVLLKRLPDALRDGDTVYAVIKGTAINNDGALKVGYTAPSVEGQARVIRDALRTAGVDAATVTYVEAHGTATTLGDPIEVAGLTRAFREEGATGNSFCAVGSVKPNIGHLDTAAGVAGLIKTVQALRYRQLPPTLHYVRPNARIDFASSPFYVQAALRTWDTGGMPRRAGVSSFGIGGTNAHAVLEEAPALPPTTDSRPWHLLTLSARTPSALKQAAANLSAHLTLHADANIADVAYTLQVGRKSREYRRGVVCRDSEEAVSRLTADEPGLSGEAVGRRPTIFLFPGQGAQHIGMMDGLYRREPTFREAFDRCAAILGIDLRRLLTEERLNQTAVTQPALFAVEYALAQLWMSWGVRPSAMLGHSLGEYVAAVIAGVMSLADALSLVAARGRLIAALPAGAMLAVPLAEVEVLPLLIGTELSVAAVNGVASTVVSGPTGEVERLEALLASRAVAGRRLVTSHAFHSAMMEPALAEFEALVEKAALKAPQIPFISNVTGTWITEAETTSPAYWARHIRQTVRFADGLGVLFADPDAVLLEVGPGQTLTALARQHPRKGEGRVIVPSCRHVREEGDDLAILLGALGKLWLTGADVDWGGFWAGERRRRVALPTYPFERKRYWVEAPRSLPAQLAPSAEVAAVAATQPMGTGATPLPEPHAEPMDDLEQVVAGAWADVLGIAQIRLHDNFFELGGDSLVASRVISRLREVLPVAVPLNAIFEAPTVAGLAARLEQLLLQKLESMSDEEAEALSGDSLVPALRYAHDEKG